MEIERRAVAAGQQQSPNKEDQIVNLLEFSKLSNYQSKVLINPETISSVREFDNGWNRGSKIVLVTGEEYEVCEHLEAISRRIAELNQVPDTGPK